jgi:hypothetical protein
MVAAPSLPGVAAAVEISGLGGSGAVLTTGHGGGSFGCFFRIALP